MGATLASMGEVEEFDVAAAGEADLDAWCALAAAIEMERVPEDPPTPAQRRLRDARHEPSYRSVHRWVARDDGGRIVGETSLRIDDTPDNRDLAFFDVAVLPESRGRGLGRRLVRAAVRRALDVGRPKLLADAVQRGPGDAFLAALGGRAVYLERESRLRLADVDRGLMESWVRQAKERADAYSLVAWDGPTPEEHLDGFVAVLHVMNTAPMEALDIEDEIFTPDRVRDAEGAALAQGYELWTMVAADGTGCFAGLTHVLLDPLRPWRVDQANTGVDPAHRGRGLGRWLKAAMALRLLDERPAAQVVDTWNQDANRPMLSINEAMGFRPHLRWQQRQFAAPDLLALLG
jgi:GNAT superfamily N-acetyltransferase